MSARTVLRRCLLASILPAVVILPAVGYRCHVDRKGRQLRDAAVARIEATDPRWRWEDIEADRPTPRDDQNAANFVAEFNHPIRPYRTFAPHRPNDRGAVLDPAFPPNRLLDKEGYRLIAESLAELEGARLIVERLSRCPRGRRELERGPTWPDEYIRDEHHCGSLMDFLECESERLVGDDQGAAQPAVLLAMLNVTRIEGDPPFRSLREWALRKAVQAARRLERTLATGLRTDDLLRLQRAFAEQAEVDRYRPAVRQVRAENDLLFRAFDSSERSLHIDKNPGIGGQADVWMYRPHMAADWAAALDFMTAALELADRPEAAWLTAWTAVPKPPRDDTHKLSAECVYGVESLLQRSLHARAILRCATVAVAIERHRRVIGEWPAHLQAISKEVLPAIPPDPYTGAPLRLVRRPDGITIYSVGPDGADDAGRPMSDYPSATSQGDLALRLYDPAHRRLPALPPATGNGQ